MAVSVQVDAFDIGAELGEMRKDTRAGALVNFTGIVRGGDDLVALELEHYPAMTKSALEAIEAEARARWDLIDTRIIHRVGRLALGEEIMMVAVSAPHRADAFQAAEFMMDFLKSRAPFWKKEHFKSGTQWVDAKDSDEGALRRW
ncbi:molybdopterin synthase catalytic subunit [Amylibacter marinus]|uniref:Molybdopterin synthase catalytic subunit n=1 Tax=Amylibacter marinus TaxID=1475483 RepID=A0ABQ5VXD9_9RHOB|nr:molybdenum cofactor biosynthesis protein MoaE [Amylibacter marinus]GLQ35920.1 molybdopterin synthase catalytic subunit [Amylibacter marinus]